jgi:hypothetical protein
MNNRDAVNRLNGGTNIVVKLIKSLGETKEQDRITSFYQEVAIHWLFEQNPNFAMVSLRSRYLNSDKLDMWILR